MIGKPKPESEIELSQRLDGRFEVIKDGYVLKVANTIEQAREWLNAYLISRTQPHTSPKKLYRAVLRTK